MKLKPVSNWREAWKWDSTRLASLLVILPIAWPQIPAEFKAMIPAEWEPYIAALIAAGVVLGRLRDQQE